MDGSKRFIERASAHHASVRGGVAPEGFEAPPALAFDTPIANVPVGHWMFFPAADSDIPRPEGTFLLARSPAQDIVVEPDGTALLVHTGGAQKLHMDADEVLGLAAPLVDVRFHGGDETPYVSTEDETMLRDALGARFDRAADLYGIPLLQNVREELRGRARGAMMAAVVGLVLTAAIVATVLAIDGIPSKLVIGIALGCVPLGLALLAFRAASKAKGSLARLTG